MRKPSIFISYSQENQLIAGKVNSYLQKCGLRTWFDKENIRPGENIEYEIKKGIKEASIFLIIISNNNSKFLDFEYMLIKKENETKDKKIIPVYTKETKPDSIFSAYQGVFLENDSIKEIDKIYTAIRNNQSIWAKLKEYIENQMMLPELKLFACGFMGSTLVEIVSILRYYQSLNNLPKRYSSIGFWIVRIALSIGAGGLAIIYEPSSFILAIHIGASTPLLIATLSEKLIET